MIAPRQAVGLIAPIELPHTGSPRAGAPCLVVDTRRPDAYIESHIPSAINLYAGAFVDPRRGLVPTVEDIADRLGNAGIARDSRLLLYDDGAGAYAGGLLWLLDRVAHPNLALVDGGISAWYAQGGALDRDMAEHAARPYIVGSGVDRHDNLATKDWILRNMARDDVLMVDTRSEAEYHGRTPSALRNGHIPGAVRLEWTECLDHGEGRAPRYVTTVEMRPKLAALGITDDKEIVCYCQAGTRSAQVYGVLRMMGFPRVRNYRASWADWGNDPHTPIQTD